jgi:hypothetical protein
MNELSLLEHIITISMIICDVCGDDDSAECEYGEHFYRSGWRAKNGKAYCPDCINKSKRNNNPPRNKTK